MVTETILRDQGVWESFAVTLRKLVADGWVAASTDNKTPILKAPSGSDQTEAHPTQHKEHIVFNCYGYSGPDRELDQSGAWAHVAMETEVYIDIYAHNDVRKELYVKMLQKILREQMPNSAVTIKKSNGTDDSPITGWKNPNVPFNQPQLQGSMLKRDYVFVRGILICTWEKLYS